MFTGIVEETGRVVSIRAGKKSTELTVCAGQTRRGLRVGHSLAVNGACLTVVGIKGSNLKFDVLNETLARTNLKSVKVGSLVNLERPMRADGRLDGHFVLGHVDATGTIRRYEKSGTDYVLEVAAPASIMRYIVDKCSVAVDGISLTVAAIGRGWFRIWIIPHTHAITALQERKKGDLVNLEADILGKYVDQLLAKRPRR
jgi:riboflavin synthase